MTNFVESVLFSTDLAVMYSIPPLRTLKGHSASQWDVESPIWKGRLKVVESEDENGRLKCEVRLEDSQSGESFATVPYSRDGKGVDPVLDSARFFAITLVDGDRRAVMGLGFPDRAIAFEFNVALQDFKKHTTPLTESSRVLKDYSLKSGEIIQTKFGINQRKDNQKDATAIPKLAPPPSISSRKDKRVREKESPFDDDFGDFQG